MPIDINSGGTIRPGGIPVHVVSGAQTPTVAGAPAAQPISALLAKAGHTVRTVDPFAFVGRARRALGRSISK